jgi:hypothetical protein
MIDFDSLVRDVDFTEQDIEGWDIKENIVFFGFQCSIENSFCCHRIGFDLRAS